MVIMYLLPYDMVQNGHSVIVFPKWLLSNITYGTKWFLVMVRNFEILWYEMAMVRND
jgi:hypothetical protein